MAVKTTVAPYLRLMMTHDGFNNLVRERLEAIARRWHREMMPRHFEQTAAAKYGYKPRTKAYMIRKARKFHHQLPLVFTGATKAAVRSNVRVSFQKGGTKVALNLFPPAYFYQQRGAAPNKPAELTVVSADEQEQIINAVQTQIVDEIKRW